MHSARLTLAAAVAAVALHAAPAAAQTFDFDTGNAPTEVLIPNAVPYLLTHLAPGDATIILRITTLITNGWFDAIAPYHPTAVGVYSRLGRRPASESATNRNKNIAIFYATYRVVSSLLPQNAAGWRGMLLSVGLDPDDDSLDLTTPVGIGNAAGNAVVAARVRDGMNQLGDEGGRSYNRQPYADYTGYQPVNTAYDLIDPTRWQPGINTRGFGIFTVQQFVTPQLRNVRPYSYNNPARFRAPPPSRSLLRGSRGLQDYRDQANEVLAASASLTDHQKMTAELFDNKLFSLGFVAFFVYATRGHTLDEFVHYDFTVNMAAFDGGIATWQEKHRFDAVRPFSAIRYLYGDQPVTAWGGPGRGTVSDLPASQWRSYLGTADHPEYPSGSACFCSAHAQASRRFLGSDALGWSVPAPAGSSLIEPGVTPSADITLGPWNTWTEFARDCGMSRHWGGVHFLAAVDAGAELCQPIGDSAYELVQRHLAGTP